MLLSPLLPAIPGDRFLHGPFPVQSEQVAGFKPVSCTEGTSFPFHPKTDVDVGGQERLRRRGKQLWVQHLPRALAVEKDMWILLPTHFLCSWSCWGWPAQTVRVLLRALGSNKVLLTFNLPAVCELFQPHLLPSVPAEQRWVGLIVRNPLTAF